MRRVSKKSFVEASLSDCGERLISAPISSDNLTVTDLVVAATDGSAINNPNGPAGWAWFVSEQSWGSGGFPRASNQVAELFAVLALLRAVPADRPLLIRTDSQFTINSLTQWMPGWKRKGWRKADGSAPANLSLLKELDLALAGRQVKFEWVKGHSGDRMNEIADRICGAASAAIRDGRPVAGGPGFTGTPDARPDVEPARPSTGGQRVPQSQTLQRIAARQDAAKSQAWREADEDAFILRTQRAATQRSKENAPVLCTACDTPINPLTFECLGCTGR